MAASNTLSSNSAPLDDDERELARDRAERRAHADQMLGMGVGIGAFGIASLATLGAVCPACVIVAPALVGAGLYKRIRAADPRRDEGSDGERP